MDLFDGLPDPQFTSNGSETAKLSTGSVDESKDLREEERSVLKRDSEQAFDCGESESEPIDSKHLRCDTERVEPLVLKGFCAELQGERDEMEDSHLIQDDCTARFNLKGFNRLAVYGVFDGHSGKRASEFAKTEIPETLISQMLDNARQTKTGDQNWIHALAESFQLTDAAFLKKASATKPPWKDGTTATVALIVDNKAYVANVGDSAAVLCRWDPIKQRHKALSLSVDHSPVIFEERQRIQNSGGIVKDGRLNGVLEVSRSLGDYPYKKCTGLISVPSIQKCNLTKDDKFLILACDGLWKALTPDEAITLVLEKTKDAEESSFTAATAVLAREAVKRLSGDNVTVVVVRIQAAA